MARSYITLYVSGGETINVDGLPATIRGVMGKSEKYVSQLFVNGTNLLTSGTATIPAGAEITAVATYAPFGGSFINGAGPIPAGKMVSSLKLAGVEMFSNDTLEIEYMGDVTVEATFVDIPTIQATFETKLDSDKAYTSVHLVVTHSDGTSEAITGGYQFQNGDIVNIAGTEYTAPGPTYDSPSVTVPIIGSTVKVVSVNVDGQPNTQPGTVVRLPEGSHVDIQVQPIVSPKIKVPTFDFPMGDLEVSVVGSSGEITKLSQGQTYMLDGSGQTVEMDSQRYSPTPAYVQLPQIPPGEMVTDYSLAGATQGQSAALEPGDTYELETVTEEYAVEVNVNYVNTTVPNVNPAKEG